jgi:hypothetical protein
LIVSRIRNALLHVPTFCSKFKTIDDCTYFAWNTLGFWPSTVDDDDQFNPLDDDYHERDDDAADDDNNNNAPARRLKASRGDAEADVHATQAAAAGASTDSVAPVFADAATASRGQDARLHEEAVETQVWNGNNREYELLQLRNGICTYDEKYGLYVKTACHGTFFWE